MSTLLRDLRHAVRMLARRPVFTLVIIGTLALGIGLNTAVFSAVDALILRPLPGVDRPNDLLQLYRKWPGSEHGSNSPAHYIDVRDRTKDVFSNVAAWSIEVLNLSADGQPRRIFGMIASANYFTMLGVVPRQGRLFVPEEDVGEGAHRIVVLSHKGWVDSFGRDPNVLGRSILLNGIGYTVVGIAPEEFRGTMPIITPTLWMPFTQIAEARPGSNNSFQTRGNNFLNVIARPAAGVSAGAIQGRLEAVSQQLREEYPDSYRDASISIVPQSEAGFHPEVRDAQYGLTSIVMAVVVLLLLIACVNVANLLLAQARERTREMAIRLGLGAKRSVIIRQLLTESVLLSIVSGAIGVVLAWWAIGLANQIRLPVVVDMTPGLEVNTTVLLFTLGVSVLTGLVFGLAPALQATRPDLIPALKGESPSGGSRSRLTRGLVVTQVALSIILLVSAGLFLRNLEHATQVDKGFDSSNLLIADFDPGLQGYSRARSEQFYQQLTERIRANPAVAGVALINDVPLGIGNSDWGVQIPGYMPQPTERMSIDVAIVSPDYFSVMGTRLTAGREFRATDDSSAARVMVINQRFVDRFWPGQDAIGRTVRTSGRDYTVIGVVPTGKYRRLGEPPTAFMWLPQSQAWQSGMSLHIRTSGDPLALSSLVRSEVASLDANLPVSNIRSMEQHLGIALLPARIAGSVLGLFGVLGLFLASIGIYGVMSGAVVQRTREIGIRIAIGAAGSAIVRLLVREGLVLVGIGTGIGLVGALAASRLIRGMLYGGSGIDPATFTAVPLILGAVALLAIWIPSRRASTVDPIEALRRE